MSYFKDVELSFPSEDNDLNTWADYCEFFCLVSENKSRTIEDLKDRLIDQYQGDFKKARKAIGLSRSSSGRFINQTMEIEEEEEDVDFEDVANEQKSNESQLSDEITSEFLFLFHFLESRSNLFGENYPFEIEIRSNKLLLVKPNKLKDRQKIYLALLLSSILRIYTASIRNKLGHLFEDLTQTPFRKLIPTKSRLEFFGAGQASAGAAYFSGSFDKRVKKLAETLCTDTTTEFKRNIHDYQHSGDGGLDWVAWMPFKDGQNKFPVFFGQCACGNDWIDKEWDAHDDKWRNFIQFPNSYLLFHFIGKSFRKHDGSWFKPGEIRDIILIDRLRFITELNKSDATKGLRIYKDLIKEALALKFSDSD